MCLSDFHRRLCWSKVRALGNSTPARLSLVIPFFGYLILFNEHVRGILKLSYPMAGPNTVAIVGLAFSEISAFYWTYFGLLLFGVASSIYQIVCAGEIKQHLTHSIYIEYRLKTLLDEDVMSVCEFLISHGGKKTDFPRIESIRDILESSGSRSDKSTKYVLYCHYTELDVDNGLYMLLCFYLYAAGLTLLVMPTIVLTYKIIYEIF